MEDELSWLRPIPLGELTAAVRRLREAEGHTTPEDTELIMRAIRLGQITVEFTGEEVHLYLRDITRYN